MDPRIVVGRLNDRGLASLQFVIASALSLIFFVALANLVVVQYARGALRSALDQGVRAGSLNGSVETCEERIQEVLSEVLGGQIGATAQFGCAVDGPVISAGGAAVVGSWTPLMPDHQISLSAEASVEPVGP